MPESFGVETAREAKEDRTRFRRRVITIVVVGGCVGVVWDVMAAAVLFHKYTFFESVVVCLLVMILCTVATLHADFDLWSAIHRPRTEKDASASERSKPDDLDEITSLTKVLFYAIAGIMAFIKLVMTLLG